MEAEKRDPGNEVESIMSTVLLSNTHMKQQGVLLDLLTSTRKYRLLGSYTE